MINKTRNVSIFLAMLFVAQTAYFYPQLPPEVASHFDYLGEPDGWMSKESFLVFQLILLAFILAATSMVSAFINKLPDALINIPNRDFWLAPERREESLAKVAAYNDYLRLALLLLFLGINHFAYTANIQATNLSDGVWIVLGIFLIFTFFWVIKLRNVFKL